MQKKRFIIDLEKLKVLVNAEGLKEPQFAEGFWKVRIANGEPEYQRDSARRQVRRFFSGERRYTSNEHVADVIARLLRVNRAEFQWKNQYRVVISCHWDIKRELASALSSDELAVDWVPHNDHAQNTLDRIRFAHAFVPIFRPDGQPRDGAVFQIGTASELEIPVFAFSFGDSLTGVVRQTIVAPNEFADIARSLSYESIHAEVEKLREQRQLKAYAFTEEYEHRTGLIAEFASRAANIGLHGKVRQRGAISCFSLPRSANLGDWPIVEGDGDNVERSDSARKDQANERSRLEDDHVEHAGAELILRPLAGTRQRGPRATIRRLEILRDSFLNSKSGAGSVRVALPEFEQFVDHPAQLVEKCNELNLFDPCHEKGNLLVVGDIFAADSINPRRGLGYRYTTFYTHSPTVLKLVDQFSEEMEECHEKNVTFYPDSAIKRINICIEAIKKHF